MTSFPTSEAGALLLDQECKWPSLEHSDMAQLSSGIAPPEHGVATERAACRIEYLRKRVQLPTDIASPDHTLATEIIVFLQRPSDSSFRIIRSRSS